MNSVVKTAQTLPDEPIAELRRSSQSWLIWGASFCFVLFQFCLQLTSGEIVSGLMKSFSLTALGGGVLASVYYYIYASLQTPAGLLIDRFGPRRLLCAAVLLCAFGCFLFGSAPILALAVLGRLLMGAGAAFAFVGLMYLVNQWFPARYFAMMMALSETLSMVGSLVAGVSIAGLVQTVGWRVCFLGASVFGVLLSGLIWSVVRDAPPVELPDHTVELAPRNTLKQDLKALLGSKVVWMNAIYSGLLFSPVTVFAALWGIPYMMLAHHSSLVQATFLCDTLFIGVAIGGPILSWFDSRGANRRHVLTACSAGSALLLAILIYCPELPNIYLIISMLLLGFGSSSYLLNLVIGKEIVSSHLCGTSIGFVNMFSIGSATVLQPLIGFLLTLFAGHPDASLAGAYTVGNYQCALSLMVVVALSGLWFVRFIPLQSESANTIRPTSS